MTTPSLTILALVLFTLLLFSVAAPRQQSAKELARRYKHKYVVALREGMAFGVCASHPSPDGSGVDPLGVHVKGGRAEYSPEQMTLGAVVASIAAAFGRNVADSSDCGRFLAEPIHKGEVLEVKNLCILGELLEPFEQDLYWKPKPLSQIRASLQEWRIA